MSYGYVRTLLGGYCGPSLYEHHVESILAIKSRANNSGFQINDFNNSTILGSDYSFIPGQNVRDVRAYAVC